MIFILSKMEFFCFNVKTKGQFYKQCDRLPLSREILKKQMFLQAKVVDSNGEMVPFGTPGELLIRGYVTMSCYYNDDEKTKETIDSTRWLHTG